MSCVSEIMDRRLREITAEVDAQKKRRAEVLVRGDVEDVLDALVSEWEGQPEEQAGIYTALGHVESMKADRGAALINAARSIANNYAVSEIGLLIHISRSQHLALVAALIAIEGGGAA